MTVKARCEVINKYTHLTFAEQVVSKDYQQKSKAHSYYGIKSVTNQLIDWPTDGRNANSMSLNGDIGNNKAGYVDADIFALILSYWAKS